MKEARLGLLLLLRLSVVRSDAETRNENEKPAGLAHQPSVRPSAGGWDDGQRRSEAARFRNTYEVNVTEKGLHRIARNNFM